MGRASDVSVCSMTAAASAQTIRRVANDVQDVLIEHCGHYPAEERPAELATAIQDFLAKPDPARAA